MMTKINQEQAQALAQLVHRLRPDWDSQGIYAVIGRARDMGTAPELCIAAINAATDETNRTPAVIALAGAHWTAAIAKRSPSTVADPNAPRCTEPGHEHELAHNCRACRSEQLGLEGTLPSPIRVLPPEQVERNVRGAHLVRQALDPAKDMT